MLSLKGVGCKEYGEWVGECVPEVSCPDPECQQTRLRGHGWYRRYVGGKQQSLRRVRCPRCRVSHALLPEDLCTYRDATLGAVELALAASGPSAGAQASGQGGPQGVRRVRRWLRSAGGHFAASLQALLAPVAGAWWCRAQQVVGETPGWLIRLRHFVWSRWSCLVGGVSGLYRHGRLGVATAGHSPHFGNCPARGSCGEASPGLRDGP